MTIVASLILALLIGNASARDFAVPDLSITPGVTVEITTAKLCSTKWGKDKRFVTAAMKRQVFTAYGIKCKPLFKGARLPACGTWEIDHLVSRELGGADDVKNLWPEKYTGSWNAHMKDRVENRLHKEVCAGNLTLDEAQDYISKDWRKAFTRYFGGPK